MAPQALQTNTLDDLICRLRPFRQQKGALVLKTELIQRVADLNPHLRASDAEKIVNTIFEEMIAAMARGDRVELRGIGAFTVRVRRGRPGRNPRTGRKVVVPQRLHPHFKPGKPMRERLNAGSAE
jgi:integration host factor subunit beta